MVSHMASHFKYKNITKPSEDGLMLKIHSASCQDSISKMNFHSSEHEEIRQEYFRKKKRKKKTGNNTQE